MAAGGGQVMSPFGVANLRFLDPQLANSLSATENFWRGRCVAEAVLFVLVLGDGVGEEQSAEC